MVPRGERVRSFFAAGALSCFSVCEPAAAAGTAPDHSTAVFVAQIVVLLVVGRLLGELAHRVGQPAIMGQLIAGILLGPSVFGWIAPEWQRALFPPEAEQRRMLDAISQLGILMLLLLTGMETNLASIGRARRAAVTVSLAGIVVPFAAGVAIGYSLPESLLPDPSKRLVTALFLGTALSIASVKIVAAVVREMGFMRRRLGQLIIASAIVDDTIGWLIVAVIVGIALEGGVDAGALARTVAGTAVFLVVSLTAGPRLVTRLILFANDRLQSEYAVITAILVLMGSLALVTDRLGVHGVLGAFVAGLLVGRSPILTRHIDAQLRGLIVALFMPVFFAAAGLQTDLTILANPTIALLAAGLIGVASLGKFAGAFAGGAAGGLDRRESLALGCAMNARGSTEVIVASIGLAIGALSQDLFSMIVAMAVVTTMAMPPTLRAALRRVPLRPDEKARLDREAADEAGFVANVERLLVAVDDSPNGRFAAHLAGLIAGSRGIVTTALHVDAPGAAAPLAAEGAASKVQASAESGGAIARAAIAKSASHASEAVLEEPPRAVSVEPSAPAAGEASHEAVAREAKKGFGLLVTGLGAMTREDGGFAPAIERIVASFPQAKALVLGAGPHLEDAGAPLDILVAVSGTDYAARAAEVAFAIANAARARVTLLHVAAPAERGPWYRRVGAPVVLAARESAILEHLSQVASHFGVEPKLAATVHRAPERAIAAELRRGNHSMLVLGVTARPGGDLYYGPTAAALLSGAKRTVVLVSS